MSIQTAETLDLLIAKFFTGPEFFLTLQIVKNGRNYGNMPGRRIYHHIKKMRTTLLDKTNNIMKKECEDAIAEA